MFFVLLVKLLPRILELLRIITTVKLTSQVSIKRLRRLMERGKKFGLEFFLTKTGLTSSLLARSNIPHVQKSHNFKNHKFGLEFFFTKTGLTSFLLASFNIPHIILKITYVTKRTLANRKPINCYNCLLQINSIIIS